MFFSNSISATQRNVWYLSYSGSDTNDCLTESTPCQNLQTILDRAREGADILVTSDKMSINKSHCTVRSSKAFSLSSVKGAMVEVDCLGE